ncbi:hypothetical protein KHM83_14940 [Fusibacter paucivorans]|uniref:Transcriptional regulator n=1 Tax=Fusibacter paucivorans TaxID=76009 RepID=A0ABS5PS34_9FIRM|nr:hypothetical protein [Fusibacter paucivorans]MBS7527979.1 hypothetical protein [Fusibacter paucivorans]
MKVGILGPRDIVENTHKVLESQKEENIVFFDLIYENYKETLSILEKDQLNMDAIMFVGKIPYAYAMDNIQPLVPWHYCPREISSLMGTFLELTLRDKKIIENLSIDTYYQDVVNEAIEIANLNDSQHSILVADLRLLDDDYEEQVINFHLQNYYLNSRIFCITGITNVYNKLRDMGIPCIRSKLTNSVILSAFTQLKLTYLIKENQNSQIVAISIAIDNLSSYSVMAQDEYEFILNKMKITELIYLFAAKIEAAVIEISNKEFLVFTTRKMLELETDHFNKFELIQKVEKKTFYTISAGIGYGSTANKAKYNAIHGMNVSIKAGGNAAYIVYSEKHIQKMSSSALPAPSNENIDKILDEISNETGVSSKILYNIYSKSKKNGLDTFTVAELSNKCAVNYRTLSRVIEKLERHGYCNIVGERIVNDRGRPSRILKLNYFKR